MASSEGVAGERKSGEVDIAVVSRMYCALLMHVAFPFSTSLTFKGNSNLTPTKPYLSLLEKGSEPGATTRQILECPVECWLSYGQWLRQRG